MDLEWQASSDPGQSIHRGVVSHINVRVRRVAMDLYQPHAGRS